MTIVRFILSLAVLLFAAYIVAMNWGAVIVSARNRRRGIDRYHSTVPFFSFFLTIIALLIYPYPDKAVWMLAVPILDIGNWIVPLGVLWLPVVWIRGMRKKRSVDPNTGAAGR